MSLIIKPLRAFLEKDTDFLTKADPYVVLILGQEKKTGKAHKEAGTKPQWNQAFQFNAKDLVLTIQIWDKDTFSPDDRMGEGTFNLKKLYSNPNTPMTQNILLTLGGKPVGGIIIDFLYKGPAIGVQGQGGTEVDQLIQQNWGKPQNGPGQGPQVPQNGQNQNQPNQGQKVQPVQPQNQSQSGQNSQGQGGFLL